MLYVCIACVRVCTVYSNVDYSSVGTSKLLHSSFHFTSNFTTIVRFFGSKQAVRTIEMSLLTSHNMYSTRKIKWNPWRSKVYTTEPIHCAGHY